MADKVLTTERIRDLYTWAYAWRTEDAIDDGESDLTEVRALNRAEFDSWLAAHDAKVKAEALREAAKDWTPAGPAAYADTARWLQERAYRIEAEARA